MIWTSSLVMRQLISQTIPARSVYYLLFSDFHWRIYPQNLWLTLLLLHTPRFLNILLWRNGDVTHATLCCQCVINQCYRLPPQKIENFVWICWWLLHFTTLIEALFGSSLLSTSACVCRTTSLIVGGFEWLKNVAFVTLCFQPSPLDNDFFWWSFLCSYSILYVMVSLMTGTWWNGF